MSDTIVKGGLGTKVYLKRLGGGVAQLALITAKEAELDAATTLLTNAQLGRYTLVEQKAVLQTRQTTIVDQLEQFQAIADNDTLSAEEIAAAETAIEDLETEQTAVDDEVTDLDAQITTQDTTISTRQTTVNTLTDELAALEAVATTGAFELIPNVEKVTVPSIKHVMDSFTPIDGESDGFPYVVPTGMKETGKFGFTIVGNAYEPIHQELIYINENAIKAEYRIRGTDGNTRQFFAFIEEEEDQYESDKLNRTVYNFMPTGRINRV